MNDGRCMFYCVSGELPLYAPPDREHRLEEGRCSRAACVAYGHVRTCRQHDPLKHYDRHERRSDLANAYAQASQESNAWQAESIVWQLRAMSAQTALRIAKGE